MDTLGVAGIASITVICYLVGAIVKATPWKNNDAIPVICALTGAVLGGVAYFLGLDIMPATEPFTAIAIGIVSGWAATGVNQTAKKISRGGEV